MDFRRVVRTASAACISVLLGLSQAEAVIIDFNALPAGHILTSADFLPGMTLSVSHNASPPDAAIIFDSDCSPGTCSGGDDDLRTPGVGPGNTVPQYMIMILAEDVVDTTPADGLVDDPDDSAAGGTLTLSFPDTCYKLIRVRAVIDFQPPEVSQIEIDKLGGGTDVVPFPLLGDNSAASINIPNPPAASEIRYVWGGSGGLDDLEFTACCGDGIQDFGEECDDGNTTNGDGCQGNCQNPECGDGILDAGEECDDGNTTDGDGCQGNCQNPECGDGILDAGEECDDGNTTDGDGCQGNCQNPECGDGILDAGEECDDGNTTDGDGCQATCVLPVCGDGIVDPGEQCDDGNTTDGDGCQGDCQNPACGDGILDAGEECDDGNTTAGDGCDAACMLEMFCGDGVIDPPEECEPPSGSTEVCDDRIDNDDDGLIDCADVDDCPAFCFHDGALDFGAPCLTHKDCRDQFDRNARCLGDTVCGDDCLLQAACTGIENDPAKIRFGRTLEHPDLFKLHGRHAIQGSIDPAAEGFVVSLANEFGTIYEGVLLPGDLIKKAGKDQWKFKDRTAKKTGGIRNGLKTVKLRVGTRDGLPNLVFIVRAYGDFSAATVPLMTTHVTTGTEGGFLHTEWQAVPRGWKLTRFD